MEQQIEEIKTQAMREGYTEERKSEEQNLLQDLMKREQQEETLWKQKSRKLWLEEGDRNTSFFHKSTVQHRQHNRINCLKSSDGMILEEQSLIEQELIQYFSDLLSKPEGEEHRNRRSITQHIPRLVTPEHNFILM